MQKLKMPVWKKCPCGEKSCPYWMIINFGNFYQGSGFTVEEKQLLNEAFKALQEKYEAYTKAKEPKSSDEWYTTGNPMPYKPADGQW